MGKSISEFLRDLFSQKKLHKNTTTSAKKYKNLTQSKTY